MRDLKAKEIVLTYFFKNINIQESQDRCNDFGANVIPIIIKPEALKAIRQHLQNGDRVIIITS